MAEDPRDAEIAGLRAQLSETEARLAEAERALRACGAVPADGEKVDPMYATVVGSQPYVSAGSGIPLRHAHPLHIKPVFDAVRGTPAADAIVALCFQGMMAWNNAQHAWEQLHGMRRQRDEALARLAGVAADQAGKPAGEEGSR